MFISSCTDDVNDNRDNNNNRDNKDNALKRLQRDEKMYQKEIEEIKSQIKTSSDENEKKHLEKLLIESQGALTDVLMSMERFKRGEIEGGV